MVALATDQIEISYAESTTGWTGDSFSLEPDIKVQGSNSVACTQTATGNNDLYFAGSFNLTNYHLRLAINFSYIGNLSTTDPLQVFLSDGTNTDYFVYYPDNTYYSGGWVDLVIDTALFTTVSLSTITQVGIRIVTATKPRNVPANMWCDNWRAANSLTITSITTETVSFSQAAALDKTNVYNILSNVDGVIFCSGELYLGSTGSSNANIYSVNEQLVFTDRFVNSSLYKIVSQENTGNTDIYLENFVCKTVGSTSADVTISSSLNSLSLIGCLFNSMGVVVINPTATSFEFNTTSFINCTSFSTTLTTTGLSFVNSNTATFSATTSNSSFINTTAVVTNLSLVSNCSFTSGGSNHAVELTSIGDGSMNWDGSLSGFVSGSTGSPVTPSSTGNEAIYVNVASGTLTINVSDGADIPSIRTAGATVNVVANLVTLTISTQDGNEVRIRQGSYTLFHTQNVSGGNTQYQYTYSANTKVIISVGGSGYVRQEKDVILSASNATLLFTLDLDPSYI